MSSLVLIGMPGAGKSTLGVLLAKALNKDFIDTDVVIQVRENCSLQNIVDQQGHIALRSIEQQVLIELTAANHIIATGGSAVYSAAGMAHLQSLGTIIHLDVSLSELERRIDNFATRGLAKAAEQSFAELYAEREPLYRQYADLTIACDGKSSETLVKDIALATQSLSAQD